ncbi:site-specific integrase [Amycolatopsis sp. NBC_01488]|uniref:tyrosine-type recombinase/integrase n=1 Tax=Amycolatopsis sp. NBC_01488 TaxID=2903563 RepID=UPI002E2CC956|nr:site-specific integrase [Amycolatopsis sp. NBC_01488]
MPRKQRPEGTRAPNGASSIYLGKDGKWHGRVTMGIRDDGKPDRRHVKRKTEAEVIEAVRELERQRDSGRVRKAGRGLTVEQWLTHWVENIAAPTVRLTTMVGYRASVYRHLIPTIGAHRLDKLQPEHLEAAYRKILRKGLKPSTVHLAHRTVRAALNEAVRRRHIAENPARIAKAPRVVEEEIVPFSREEARRLITAAGEIRNGARFIVALSLGLRRGEALGLKWSDVTITWKHGCARGEACRRKLTAAECPARRGAGTITVRRSIQQLNWQHGCTPDKPCGHEHGAYCPERFGGGLVVGEVKSRAGRRVIGLPRPVIEALEAHRGQQEDEREAAANLWEEGDWVFATPIGRPTHPTPDNRAWKALLRLAGVRNARLHDARHTAATVLLELKVPLPAVMELMGWSNAAVAKRYMHVNTELVTSVAEQVGAHMWAAPDDEDEDEDGPEGALVPA